jgi:hypothetical protein
MEPPSRLARRLKVVGPYLVLAVAVDRLPQRSKLVGMTSADLTPDQRSALFKQLGTLQRNLRRLHECMDAVAFEADDELFVLAKEAHDAAHRLAMRAPYRSCGGGV